MSQCLSVLVLTAITRLLHDGRGASAILVAIALPVLIGFGTLGAETGLWYTIKRQNQSAADAAAISAAYEVIAGKANLAADLTPAASEAAAQNGYTGAAPLVVHPYADSIVNNGVAVTLQQTQPGLLASLFLSSVTIATKAVTVIKVLNNPCILALAMIGTDVEVGASSALDVANCSVATNSKSASSINIQSSTGSITAAGVVTRGEISFSGNAVDPAVPPPQFVLAARPMIGAPTVADPYAKRLSHAFLTTGMPAQCAPGPPYPANSQICGDLSISGSLTLSPGTYWITDGGVRLEPNATLHCTSCTIILTTLSPGGTIGNIQIPSSATVTLQAQNSGIFAGLLVIQDRLLAPSGSSAFEGGDNMRLTGLLYFSETTVDFGGNPNATCTVLITKQVLIDRDSSFNTSGCKAAGLATLPTVRTVALVE